ncbi:DUF2812 domain-containing protein [Bacillus sp. FJAT-49736]|uniref:DUF2812 domain-containing protein n=1 Tax=Bacillus sp. FJAT-49736 TaxID=2833582 RepID=UPI001BCA0196|nr:DUF2812 domain-containing protein [Bacillus sp. FJAT-49736]MBS4175140.1 DUF2812 domain-containing protein [Bacillus sp. FJAT-49736]
MKKRVFKLLWAWQDDEENNWLESMAEQGWMLEKYNLCVYTFVKTEPKKVIYKTDYKSTNNKDLPEYITLFEDAGWEHVTQYIGWHYFRAETDTAKTTEIYSDSSSKIEMYKKLFMTIFFPLLGIILIALSIIFNPSYAHIKLMIVLKIVYVILICLLTFAVINILLKMKRLRE